MDPQEASLALRTNAKVNLFLAVGSRGRDGYHEIETVFHSVSLADAVTVDRRPDGGVVVLMHPTAISGHDLPEPEDNLVTHALRAFSRRAGFPVDVEVRIDKRIPLAAGLAGGSGNAAGALLAANELYGEPLGSPELREVAGEVGSDVPFCLVGGTALGFGRGERLKEMKGPRLHLVLGLSRERLSTSDVYERAREDNGVEPGAMDFMRAMDAGDVPAIAAALRNDLEPAALELLPALAPRKEALLDAGALGALLCGSGPGLFGIARDEDHAREIAGSVRGSFERVEVVRSAGSGVERSG